MNNRANKNQIGLTVDVDWAPDFMIDFVAAILIEHEVRATWFITHESPALARLRAQAHLFELGIHPNFFPGSTHGDTPKAVLRHCMELVPDAVSIRSHGLLQSTTLLAQILEHTPVKIECSLFLPRAANLEPIEYQWERRTLLRLPYFWEDDLEMERTNPCWQLKPLLAIGSGLKIFDFHPVHVCLNSSTMESYRQLKERVPHLSDGRPEAAAEFRQSGSGSQTLFVELVRHLAETGQACRMHEIYEYWQERVAS